MARSAPARPKAIPLDYGDGTLEVRVEPALGQAAVTLRTYSHGRATNVAFTLKSQDASELGALILEVAAQVREAAA